MTVPNFDFLNPQQTPDLSFLDVPGKESGVFSYLGNLASNAMKVIATQDSSNPIDAGMTGIANLLYGNTPEQRTQLKQIKANLEAANVTKGEAWDKVKEDLSPKNFFSKMSEIHEFGSAGDMISGLPMALASTVGSPLEAATGLSLGQQSAPVLTPEERAGKIKETAAIAVSSLVGGVTRLAVGKALAVEAGVGGDLALMSNPALNAISQGGKIGQLGRNLIKGGLEAGAAGATFGAVANANTENQLGGVITGLMFAPLGMAAEMLGSKIHGGDDISKIQQKAGDLFAMRQLSYSPDKTLFEMTKSLEAIATSDNLAMAVAKGQIETGSNHIIVQNVSQKTADAVVKEGETGGYYQGFVHKTEEGQYHVLLANDARVESSDINRTDKEVFKKTGYLPNEVVSYKGKDYLFDKESARIGDSEITIVKAQARLKDPVSQKVILADWNEITRNSVFNLDNGKVMIDSPLTLKGKLLAVNKERGQAMSSGHGFAADIVNPYTKENDAALNSVETGKPIAFIGMRQSRGQQIIGNGKFYALSPEHLLNYTPAKWEGYSADVIKGIKGESPTETLKLGSLSTAPGRQTIPGILDANLSVNRLVFENPFVFNGKHYSFSRDIQNFYNKYVKGTTVDNLKTSSIVLSSGNTSAVSQMGVQWGKIFTIPEMKGIIEARALEQKPIGVPTNKYLASLNPEKKVAYKAVLQAEQDHFKGVLSYDEYTKISQDYFKKYGHDEGIGLAAGKTHSESHYAIIDRIVATAMKRNGHDGFIYRSGGIHNSEIVDIKERGVFNRADQTVPVEGKASNILDAQKFVDKLYAEFSKDNLISEAKQDELGVLRQANARSWEDRFNSFANQKGVLPEEAPNLRRSFEQRLHKEIVDALPDTERPLFIRLQQEIVDKEIQLHQNGVDNLKQSALSNNMYFDQADAGVIHLRDGESNKSLGTFHSVQDAQEFISKSGQGMGPNLDGNANIPPSSSAPPKIPDNVGPLNSPPSGWLEKKYALWTTRLSFATANPTLFKNWDTLFKSNLHSNVFNIVDQAAKLTDGKKSVWLAKLKTADNLLGKATMAEREHTFNWMETRSIQEHEQFGGIGKKPLSPMELALGKQIQNADLVNMYRYKNAMRSVLPNSPDFAQVDAAMKAQFNITPNEIQALTMLSIAEKSQVEKLSIGASVHYARLLQNPELALTRAEYAKKFNLSPKQLQTGQLLDKYFDDLADVAGISKDKVLFNYITHARLYENGSLPDAIAKYALDKPTEEFYAALNRTGELDHFERDPIRAALRYTNALFDTLYLNPAINTAKENLKNELAKLPAGAGLKVERDASKYLRDVRHIPAEGDRYADAALNHLAGNLGINVEKGIARKWVNGMNETFTVAAQGARVWAGIRDFYSNTSKYFIKWGAKDTAEMLHLGATADLEKLQQSGLIENYTQLGLNSAVDETASALSHAGSRFKGLLDKTAHKALVLSGQQMVNDMARAGAFLVTRNKVAKMLRGLHSGEFGEMSKPETFQKAYHELQLERYSPAVIQEFDRMIKNNKTEEAANYLGNQHIQETYGNYANANHPSGWNNNFGRLVGKFGQWSINHRDYVVSLASRGTRTQKLQALGRLAMTESSIAAAATLFGVNLSNFYSIPGMYFKGGPAGDLFYTAYNAMFGRGMEQAAAIRKVQGLLPYDQVNDKMKGSIIVPFSFALTDLVEGLEMASNGDMIGGLARVGGVRPQNEQYQPSKFEQVIGNTVMGR